MTRLCWPLGYFANGAHYKAQWHCPECMETQKVVGGLEAMAF